MSIFVFVQAINYLNDNSFGYPGSDSVTTNAPANITMSSADLKGSSSLAGITDRGFEYGASPSYGQSVSDSSALSYDFDSKIGDTNTNIKIMPYDTALSSNNTLYIADFGSNRIIKMDTDGNKTGEWGTYGNGYGQFSQPRSVAIDSQSNVYVTDNGNNRIQKFDSSGNFITVWGSGGSGDGQFNNPQGLSIDSNDNVYVADGTNKRIQKFDSSGNFITVWGSNGTGDGQFNFPSDIAVGATNMVYVTDYYNNRIQKFDSSGNYISQWQSNSYPSGITIDTSNSNNVLITHDFNHILRRYDSEGNFISEWGSEGSSDGQFNQPKGLSVDSNGRIYVADLANYRIQKFNSAGSFSAKWNRTETAEGKFNKPEGVAQDSNGNIYVADSGNDRIQKFDPNGQFVIQWGSTGTGDGKLNLPENITVDNSGNVYVADRQNYRVQKFDSSGNFITKWGTPGSDDGQFSYLRGITVDNSGNVYVSDISNQNIQKFDSSGNFITKWGTPGSGDGQFSSPSDITYDLSGNIYVTDTYNQRVQKFDSSGNFITKWGTYGSDDGQFSSPSSLSIDSNGDVVVLDTNNNRIQKFDSSGNFLSKFGELGNGDGQLYYPKGLTTIGTAIVVANTSNNRIEIFNHSIDANISSLSCATSYHFRAYATNGSGTQYGADQEFQSSDCLQGPSGLTGTERVSRIDLEWDYLQNANNYEVDYKKSADSDWIEYLNDGDRQISGNNLSITGLESGVSYDIRVRGVMGNGDRSEWTSTLTISTRIQQTYHITNCVELQSIGVNPNTFEFGDIEGNYILDNDIDCSVSASWAWEGLLPSGYASPGFLPIMDFMNSDPFMGNINGQGHSVSNIYQSAESIPIPTGLVAVLQGAKIENITIENSTIIGTPTGYETGGAGLVSVSIDSEIKNVHIKELSLTASTFGAVGGAVAKALNTTLDNVTVNGSITTKEQDTSGKLNSPTGIAIDSSGNMFVSDSENDRIQKFNPSGQYVSKFGSKGNTDGLFNNPMGIAIDSSGNIFVADSDNHRIQKFDSNGQYISQFGSNGSGDGQFYRPRGIAISNNGSIFIVDAGNARIQKFDSNGQYISQFGSYGSSDGQLMDPSGIILDASENIYITDTYNHRIQKFDSNGQYISQFGSNGSGDGQFSYPIGLIEDSNGNFYVSDSSNNRIQKFDSNGQYISQFGSNGSGDGEFATPMGLAIDASDKLNVVDSNNHRIQKFDSNGQYISQFGTFGFTVTSEISSIGGVAGSIENDEASQRYVSKVSSEVDFDIEPLLSQQGIAAGGIFGLMQANISNSFSNSNIIIDGQNRDDLFFMAGGAIGSSNGTIDSVYTDGNVEIQNTNNVMVVAGGIVGTMMPKDISTVLSIENSFSVASVSAPEGVYGPAAGLAGLVGDSTTGMEVSNNYYDRQSTGSPQCFGMVFDDNYAPTTLPTGACTTINSGGTQPSYFINNQTNPPLDQWNFDSIWKTNSSIPPTFIGSEAPVPTIPGSPRNLAMANGSIGSAVLSWLVPSSTGNSAITDYVVQYKLASSATWITVNDGVSATTGVTIGGLSVGQQYNFRVAAVNAIGQGSFTNPITAGIATVPSAPRNTTVTPMSTVEETGFAFPQVEWDIPLDGAPITNYIIQFKNTNSSTWQTFDHPVSSDTLAVVDLGLTNLQNLDLENLTQEQLDIYSQLYGDMAYDMLSGAVYQFRVAAVNEVGTGAYSEPVELKLGYTASSCNGLRSLLSGGITKDGYKVDFGSGPVPLPQLHILLTEDIDCSETVGWSWSGGQGWEPLGDEEFYFAGDFDGRGYKIQDIFIDRSPDTTQQTGIFEYTKGAKIYNLELSGGSVKGGGSVGSLAGTIRAGTVLDNVKSSVNVSGEQIAGGLAGITAQDGNIQIKNSTYNGTIWSGESMGGLVGFALTGDQGVGEFNASSKVVDSAGNIYIAGNQMIQKFDSSGNYIKQWGNTKPGYNYGGAILEGEFSSSSVVKLSIDSQNNIYATDSSNSRVQKFNSDGEFLLMIGGNGPNSYPVGSGSGNSEFYSFDLRITVDSNDNLYVLDTNNDRVQKFSSNGVFVSTWGSTGTADGEFSQAKEIMVDSADNIYVYSERDGSYSNTKVQKFSSSGVFMYSVGSGADEQALSLTGLLPNQIMTTDQNSNLLVLDNSKVKIYDSSGMFVRAFDTQDGASSIATDAGGNIYVTSSYSSSNIHNGVEGSLVKFSTNGIVIDSILRGATSPDLLGPSWDVWISQSGQVHVLTGNNKETVKRYTADLEYIAKFDGTENNNNFITEISDSNFSGTVGQGDNPEAGIMVGGGIIGASGDNDSLSNVEVDFTSMFLGASSSPNIIISRSNASIDFGDECTSAGGIIGASYSSQINIEDSTSVFKIGCVTNFDQYVGANGGLIGISIGGLNVARSSSDVQISSSVQTSNTPSSSSLALNAAGGLIGVQIASDGGIVIDASQASGSIDTTSQVKGLTSVGGLVGLASNKETVLQNSLSGVDIAVDSSCSYGCYVGGLMGTSGGFIGDGSGFGGTVAMYGVQSTGDITVSPDAFATVGGGAGFILNGVAIIDDYTRSGQLSVTGGLSVAGGIAGVAYAPDATVTNAKVTGNLDIAAQDIDLSSVSDIYGYRLGISGGMFGVLASGQATVDKSYVSGNVSSPIMAGGLVGATVGLDVNLDAILGLYPSMITSPQAGISDIVGPGTIDINNTYVSGDISTKSIAVTFPAIPSVPSLGGQQIEFPDNIQLSFGGFAGGIVGVGANTNIRDSYVSGDVETGNGGINFDVKEFIQSTIAQAPEGTVSDDLLNSLNTLVDVGETLLKGASGGMAGFYVDRAPTDGSYPDYAIQNTFTAGKVGGNGQKGSIVGMTPSYVLSILADSNASFKSPQKVAVDADGNSYVTDLEMNRVQKFDSSGLYISEFGEEGTGNGQFDRPRGIAIDADGNIVVADFGNHRIQKFDSSGNYISQFATDGFDVGQQGLPGDIDFDSSGNIYVLDFGYSFVSKYSSTGTFISRWGAYGSADGEFRSPAGITVDGSNNVFVADTVNNRIQKFDSNGNFQSKWGSEGTADGQFYNPYGITTDSNGDVYVADTNSNRIQKFNSSASFITSWGTYGSGNGELNGVQDVDAGISGSILAVDAGNHRIQEFSNSGDYINKWGRSDSPYGITSYDVDGDSTIANTYFDKTSAQVETCGSVLDVTAAVVISQSTDIAQSLSVKDLSDGSCNAVNQNNSQPTYFKNNTTNPPLNVWNFSSVWKTNYNNLPDFVGSTAPTPNNGGGNSGGGNNGGSNPPSSTTPKKPKTPVTPPTTSTPSQSPGSQTKAPKPVALVAPLERQAFVKASFTVSLRNLLTRVPKPFALLIPFSILALLLALAALYTYSASVERHRRNILLSLQSQIKATTSARRTYLQLTSHYINTPIAKMQAVIELLALGVPGLSKPSSSSRSASLAIATPTMTVPEDLIVGTRKQLNDLGEHAHKLLEQSQVITPEKQVLVRNLSELKSPSLLTRPAVWLPVAIIFTATIAVNFLFLWADRFDPNLINFGVQVGVALVGVVGIVVSYYFLQKLKALRNTTQQELDIEKSLANQQSTFIAEAHELLAQDLLVLTQLGVGIARYPNTEGFIAGRMELTSAVTKLEQLNILSQQDSSTAKPISVHEQVEVLKDQMQPLATKQKVTITIHETPDLLVVVSEQSLLHLLIAPVKNAIQASPPDSEVVLDITRSDKIKNQNAIRIKVTDHGSGIASDKLDNLFKPFSTVVSPEQFTDSGLGLDLYFVKLLCEQYNGLVDIQSTKDEGTVVSIDI